MAAVALRRFFRKIHITNVERIPRNKPVILAANHPTAFIEPCVLACFLDRPLYFLVRGDLFKKPVYARMLRSLHMLPVYRMKDRGYAYLKRNYETFNYCYDALNENKTVMILAEGRTIHEKRLRPIQKGTARIAFGTLEQYPDREIYVVPVGVNYTYADRPGSEVMIDFGEPILASQYWEQYQHNSNQAITDLTQELRSRLEKRVIIIDRKADEELTEYLLRLNRSERLADFHPDITQDQRPFEEEKAIADCINDMGQKERGNLLMTVRRYFEELEQSKITDAALKRFDQRDVPPAWLILLGWAPYQLVRLFFWPPLRLAKYIADSRVRAIEFYSSVWIASGIATVLLYGFLWFIVAAIVGSWSIAVGFLVLLILRYIGFGYQDAYRQWQDVRRVRQLGRDRIAGLLARRKVLLEQCLRLVGSR